jgi:hypothetical protein
LTKKYHEGPVEYKYIESLNKLLQRLYFIYAEEQAGNNNFLNEKIGIINFFTEQLENAVDKPKGTEYIIIAVSGLPKGIFKTGSGILNTLLNELHNVVPEMHLPCYSYCGPFTKLDERLARGDKPINKLDAGCQQHDIYYRDHKDTKDRHGADMVLAYIAKERMYASDASIAEKVNAALVRADMNGKSGFWNGFEILTPTSSQEMYGALHTPLIFFIGSAYKKQDRIGMNYSFFSCRYTTSSFRFF